MRRWSVAIVLAYLLAVLYPVPLQARQPVVISGKITDTRGRPVPAALIIMPALNESTVSDAQGTYRLVIHSKVRSGQEAVLRASRKGFDYVSRSVRLAPGVQLKVNFQLTAVK